MARLQHDDPAVPLNGTVRLSRQPSSASKIAVLLSAHDIDLGKAVCDTVLSEQTVEIVYDDASWGPRWPAEALKQTN